VYEKPATAELAFSTGIDGVDRNPIADAKSLHLGTKLNHLAGKLVAKNQRYGSAGSRMGGRGHIERAIYVFVKVRMAKA
jgi:hypothetical protein